MFSRKDHEKEGVNLPQDWEDNLKILLHDTYQEECIEQKRAFEVYSQLYPNELLLIIPWINYQDDNVSPITLFLSVDVEEKKTGPKELEQMIDMAGLILDDIIKTKGWNEYTPNWLETPFKNKTYHYKVTRENIKLSLMAERLLQEGQDKK